MLVVGVRIGRPTSYDGYAVTLFVKSYEIISYKSSQSLNPSYFISLLSVDFHYICWHRIAKKTIYFSYSIAICRITQTAWCWECLCHDELFPVMLSYYVYTQYIGTQYSNKYHHCSIRKWHNTIFHLLSTGILSIFLAELFLVHFPSVR